ncbi:hypothetical protein Ctob_003729 [Chrysochromulina tobinii]|uniref:Uncharacterized protein n=1 Tax=Chrysochromulina tobinii TaxID=1460289 RepID=A0A0M0JAT1_9EUKA|nr:hypothetical protein Ctob_003729 [Chrysochromulina tobinii]|eukprot:KOO23681.1 hypothetical protein Ctob_003729 [Chrysochromulina sp. CCMP291]
MAAFLTLRARRDDGSLARGAQAAELVAAHEVIMQQPEWKRLHDGRCEILTEQTFGESMLLHDAASRNNPELIRDGSGGDTGAVADAVDTGVTCAARDSHVPMHAAALEHGAAANGTGPRTPFAQAWPGADPVAPSRALVTARAVAPPLRAVEIARNALLTTAAAPAMPVAARRGAAELEESQRMLIERSIKDARCDEDGLGISGASDELLRGLLTAAMLAVEKRFAPSTRGQDRSYWRMWAEWCDSIGTPPLRTNSAANDGRIEHLHRREVALALGAFMTWAAEAEQRGYKTESMLNRLRGVARRHWAVTIRFVSLALVVQAAQGLVREHIDAHGADALRRRSKEPLETAEIFALLNLPKGTLVAHGSSCVVVGDNLEWQGVVVFINLYCTGGWRKEAIALGPKEVFGGRKLSLSEVTYRIGGTLHREPTVAILQQITWGDMCYINPVPCKNDPDNSKFGSSPVPSRYHATQPICLVRELAKYEIMRMRADPIASSRTPRKEMPLVLSPAGRSWAKADLGKFFDGLIRHVCSEERAKQLSVHSFRVWLACALLAAGATPEQIMLMAGAVDASFDSIRAHTLLDASAAAAVSDEARAAAEALQATTSLIDAVTVGAGAHVAAAKDLRRTCNIDDDDVFGLLDEASHALEGLAVSADAAFTETAATEPQAESDDEP